MLIHTDSNGVQTYASSNIDGVDTDGHLYEICFRTSQKTGKTIQLEFQRGPAKIDGVNGITNEALLAILAHRIRALNTGPFSCRENSLALTKIEEATHWLEARTKDRVARSVEGESKA